VPRVTPLIARRPASPAAGASTLTLQRCRTAKPSASVMPAAQLPPGSPAAATAGGDLLNGFTVGAEAFGATMTRPRRSCASRTQRWDLAALPPGLVSGGCCEVAV